MRHLDTEGAWHRPAGDGDDLERELAAAPWDDEQSALHERRIGLGVTAPAQRD